MDNIGPTLIAVLTSIVGLAMLAVVVSKKGQAPQVIQAGGTALAGVIGAAVSPLGGGSSPLTGSNNNATAFGTGITGGLVG